MKKYIDKDEIKRALKMCEGNCFRVCCPYGDTINCCGELKRDALNLITEQEQEIERLKVNINQAKIDVLNKLKRKYGFYICCSWCHETKLLGEIIDKFMEEIQNEN